MDWFWKVFDRPLLFTPYDRELDEAGSGSSRLFARAYGEEEGSDVDSDDTEDGINEGWCNP